MTDETGPAQPQGGPGRIAAVIAAVAVCALTVAAALGLAQRDPAGGGRATNQLADQVVQSPPIAVHVSGTDADLARIAGRAAGSDSTGSAPVDTSLPGRSGTGKRIVFDMTRQRVWLVGANDKVSRTYLVSGSKFHNLQPGTYHVYSRSRTATAYNSPETMQYMVRFTQGPSGSPIGFHSVPAYPDGKLAETRSQLGTPQSDGCVRQWITDARALWAFAPDGTTVVVRA